MNSATTLQIPISNSLKRDAKNAVQKQGFSSLQDFVRLILTKLVRNELTVTVGSKEENITLTSSAKKRYANIVSDIKTGRNVIEAKNPSDFLRKLHS